ncbi:virulence factor family protein [Paraburkholderia rhizosphaerae]|uniref:virulence factor family protein n=1 Tax=Paraburkholderia rhizosphaerae TaxID=480658 RepID=UPI0035EBB2FE
MTTLLALASLGALVAPAAHAQTVASVSGGRYGDVAVTKPAGDMHGFVVLFSDARGWTPSDQQAADALARDGALVVGVDTRLYAAKLATARHESCHNLYSDAEDIGHQLERQVQSSRYFSPILAGTGEGALLAERALAQAPANTIGGAVSLDPNGTLDARFAPCPADPGLSRGTGLPGFLAQGVTSAERGVGASSVAAAPATAATATIRANANVTRRTFAAGMTKAARLAALTEPHLSAGASSEEDVSDLPLIELPAAHPTDMLAIVISGDGGWRDLDKTIAESLQRQGVSVIGWDALRYFWSEKTPAQTSHDLARVLQTYGSRWHARDIALVGYSFGADVMPFAYNRLPAALRAKVSFVSLLGFAPDADFQIRVTGWLGMPASDKALQVKPELAKMPPAIIQCVYGEKEEDTLCPSLTKTGIELVRTPGDHHFGGNYDALAKHIVESWKKQIAVRAAAAAAASGAAASGLASRG